jgi:hypothetical protein
MFLFEIERAVRQCKYCASVMAKLSIPRYRLQIAIVSQVGKHPLLQLAAYIVHEVTFVSLCGLIASKEVIFIPVPRVGEFPLAFSAAIAGPTVNLGSGVNVSGI